MSTDSKILLAEATAALEAYRPTLTPGVYCFASVMQNGKPTRSITMRRVLFATREQDEETGVLFCFWPLGFTQKQAKAKNARDFLFAPPPIQGVRDRHKAPDLFLSCLVEFVNDHLVTQARQRNEAEAGFGTSAAQNSQRLVSEAIMALEVYRHILPSGHYRFYAESAGGDPTGRIREEKREIGFPDQAPKTEHGVLFGFWPWGVAAPEFTSMEYDFPQILEIPKLNLAPDSFLEILTRHVNRKTGLDSKTEN